MTTEKIECSPVELINDVIGMMRVRTEEYGLTLAAEYHGSIPETIDSDPTRIRQILINLVGNAIKFTRHGGVRIIAKLVHNKDDDHQASLCIDVVDTGIGMTEDQVDSLFQAFVQADTATTRQFGGTGLGLTISRRFAQMLGGDIEVDSTAGEGSTFRVMIDTGSLEGIQLIEDPSRIYLQDPMLSQQSMKKERTEKSTPKENQSTDAPLAGYRILLAEDGPDNQRLISFVLKKAGAEIDVAENGAVAIQKIQQTGFKEGEQAQPKNPYDVILMDMLMPELDGYDATKQLREWGYDKPIIALTANAMEGDREKCINAGCDDYETKPIDRMSLIETIRRYAEEGRAQLTDAD